MRKLIPAFIILMLLLGSHYVLAQEESPAVPEETPSKIVTAIEVKGNKNISTNTVVSKMKTRIGSPYQENVVSDDLKRLYLLGFFSDIKIDTEDYKDGVKVIVSLNERPIVEKISFSGIERITMKDEKLKEKLKTKIGQYLDYPTLGEDTDTLKKMYERMGFSSADVRYDVEVNAETNKAAVTFTVSEGKKIRVKDIIVTGNKAFNSNKLRGLLKTKSAWFFNAGVLKDDVLKEDVERLKAFYRKNGYTDAAVSYEVKPDAKRPYLLHIFISIEEGRKYLVGTVTIKGNEKISEKEILKTITNCVPGKVYNEEALKADAALIHGLYFDRGYISAQVLDSTFVNPETKHVDVAYSITENQVYYVNKIKIRGNIKTKDVVVRREMRIYPGDRFDGEKLRLSKNKLQELGFFDEVSYDTEDVDLPDKKDLVVDVKETKTGAFSFGGGYSTVDDFVGFIEIEQKNFDWRNFPYFTGDGQDLKVRASFGTITSGYDISFTEPWAFDYPVTFGFDAYNRSHKRDENVGYGYDEEVTGGDLRLGKELNPNWRTDLTYRFDNIDISNISEDASSDLKNEEGTNTVSSLTGGLTFDTRDSAMDPHKGDILGLSYQLAGGPLGGDKNFWKFEGRASHFVPLWRQSILEFRARVGLAEPFKNSDQVPIYERFFAGGAYTIRGYEERAVGPVDPVSNDPLGGQSYLVGNVEYTYPIFNFLRGALFFDFGNVWEKISNFGSNTDAYGVANSGGFKSSFGLGFRVKTPIGPIMLDYGIPMDKASGQQDVGKGRFHFSATHGF